MLVKWQFLKMRISGVKSPARSLEVRGQGALVQQLNTRSGPHFFINDVNSCVTLEVGALAQDRQGRSAKGQTVNFSGFAD